MNSEGVNINEIIILNINIVNKYQNSFIRIYE